MNVKYFYFETPRLEGQARAAFEASRYLMPAWVSEIRIQKFANDNPNAIAKVHMMPEYRKLSIEIYPMFFEDSDAEQARHLRHEILHTLQARFIVWVEKVLLGPIKERNAELYEYLNTEFRERVESVTTEMEFAHERWMEEQGACR